MRKFDILVMYFAAALSTCVMYATQPLQPLFEALLDITKFQASLFTTSILAPLAVASIIYGYFLEKFSIKTILLVAFVCFGILEICFAFSSSYFWLLNIRASQGLIAPAALTGIMSYISQNSPSQNVAQNIGKYIGITIIGGFVGRFLAGFFNDIFGSWRVFFVVLGILLFVCAFLLSKISSDTNSAYIKPKFGDIAQIFAIPHNKIIFFYIFCAFFAFQAILNFLPFELFKIDESYSGSKTGILYIGYIIAGVSVSFNAKKIVNFFRTAPMAMFVGAVIFIAGILALNFRNFYFIIFAMLIVCLGNFITHSVASGYLNSLAKEHKAISNGLYVSFYYCGGALGSFVPSVVYNHTSWWVFLAFISSFLVICALLSWSLNAKTNSQ